MSINEDKLFYAMLKFLVTVATIVVAVAIIAAGIYIYNII